MQSLGDPGEAYTAFMKEVEPGMRYALVAALGAERGLDATAEAFAYAWEHWERVDRMENPGGYLYRLGLRYARRLGRLPRPVFPAPAKSNPAPWVEPGLPEALTGLSMRQRTVVVLVGAYGFTHKEAADLLGISASSVQKHMERGLSKLRKSLGVWIDA